MTDVISSTGLLVEIFALVSSRVSVSSDDAFVSSFVVSSAIGVNVFEVNVELTLSRDSATVPKEFALSFKRSIVSGRGVVVSFESSLATGD